MIEFKVSNTINLWHKLQRDVQPPTATIAQYGASDYEKYTGRMKIRHDGQTWWIGVTDERKAQLIDGRRPLPDWLDEVLFHMGIEEVEK